MTSLSPEVQDVCAVVTRSCLALISGELKISDALTWSTCSPQKCISVTCAPGALNARRMPHYCNGCELQYWTWDYLRYVKVNEADSELPNVTSAAGTCHQCTSWSSTALSSWVQVWGKPKFSHTHFHSPSKSPDSGLALPQPSPASL